MTQNVFVQNEFIDRLLLAQSCLLNHAFNRWVSLLSTTTYVVNLTSDYSVFLEPRT